ncbi:MAG TPA: serpin family protein, partial [Polyangiales bacterium]|nr:serpin family protein [Polyangiales bacterium]
SLVIVLPAAGMFEPLRRQLSEAWLQQALGKLGPALVTLRLPKFKIETDRLELGEGLQKLGMKQAFELGADFSGISTGTELMISDVVQKAFIAIDEKGTEAAAATAVVASVPPSAQVPVDPPKTFSVDRPFLFVLRDRSGAVLFVGHVVDPSK